MGAEGVKVDVGSSVGAEEVVCVKVERRWVVEKERVVGDGTVASVLILDSYAQKCIKHVFELDLRDRDT